jgi:hypothetical protein
MLKLFIFLLLPLSVFTQSRDFDAKKIKKHLSYLASDKLEGRGTGSKGEQLAAAYLIKQFEKIGLKPMGDAGGYLQGFPAKKGLPPKQNYVQSANIVGYLDNGAENTIVIGAHYDHLGVGDQGSSLAANSEGIIHNGADDNASGTSGLVELARYYANNRYTEKNNFLFILFSGEELGLIGSKYFCDNPTIDFKKVNFMLNMDMIGRYRDDKGLTIGGYGTSSFWGKNIPQITKNLYIKYNIDSTGVGPSDHTSFYLKNVPVLFFFTGSHSDYHKPSDDTGFINFKGEAKILELAQAIIKQADASPKLDFVQTSNPHAGSTRSTFKVTMGIMPDYSFDKGGVKIDGVSKDRPAAKAGLQAGDVLIKLGEYDTKDVQEYMKTLGKFEKGQTVEAEIKRGNEKMLVKITF